LSGALDAVERLLLLQEWPACLLLGVDSLVATERLVREVAGGRVAGPRNVTGFVPGEAAAAVRLSLRMQDDTDDDDGWPAIITGWGRGVGGGAEPASSAAALAEAADRALAAAGLPAAALGAVCHDGSGDWGQLEELALADRQPPLSLAPQAQRFMPAISTGEVGAAAGVLSLAFLSMLLSKGVLSQPALAMFCADGAARGAAVLVPGSSDAGTPRPVGRAAGRANDGGQE
jgi:3-oxoacyl-[acyl-carrier-protein] synthase-1